MIHEISCNRLEKIHTRARYIDVLRIFRKQDMPYRFPFLRVCLFTPCSTTTLELGLLLVVYSIAGTGWQCLAATRPDMGLIGFRRFHFMVTSWTRPHPMALVQVVPVLCQILWAHSIDIFGWYDISLQMVYRVDARIRTRATVPVPRWIPFEVWTRELPLGFT